MSLKPRDKQRLATLLFVFTLGVVAWGFTHGWFLPEPPKKVLVHADPQIAIMAQDLYGEPTPTGKGRKRVVPPKRPAAGDPVGAKGGPPLRLRDGKTEPDNPLFRPWTPEVQVRPARAERGAGVGLGSGLTLRAADPRGTPRKSSLFGGGVLSAERPERAERPEEWIRYTGKLTGHWIDDITRGGALLELEDGSAWEVALHDQITVRSWQPAQNVTVLSGGLPPYPYRITGLYGRGAEVRLVRRPSGKRTVPGDAEDAEVEQ